MAKKKPANGNKFETSVSHLKDAWRFYVDGHEPNHVRFMALAKAFETAVEYAWKHLKRKVEDEGLEAPTPKEAIRQAAKIKLIKNASAWIEFINVRNSSTHDYFGISESYYIKNVSGFLKELEKLMQ